MGRPKKYETDGERRRAQQKQKHEWATRNQEYVRKQALRRYHSQKHLKPPRKYVKPKYSRAPLLPASRIKHIRRPCLHLNHETNLNRAMTALWKRATHDFFEHDGSTVLVHLYSHFIQVAHTHQGEEGVNMLNDLHLHVVDATKEAARICEEATRRDPGCIGEAFRCAKSLCRNIECVEKFYWESLVWYKSVGLEILQKKVFEGALVWTFWL
ncbi:hypothetical protein M422DRAFT_263088 [Sphaerobolus stellatus SS14]|uniref:Uncharacterized protein n=1 Tax=Sphaerobolus stellatus (strain SS14) TaxID=990650 RepID=A0A0C9VBL6_SPHS4|nr:hypothetical protein M422DRAFT_263088 [Sphaerobolus stellatus SS14]